MITFDNLEKLFFNKFFFIFSFITLLDQITKLIILKNFDIFQSVEITPFLNIILVFNKGAAFSILSDGFLWQKLLLIITSIAVILFLIFLLVREKKLIIVKIAYSLIIAGAVGNLIDRVRLGMVVDFVDFHIGNLHWPTFNIADSAITIGVIILIFFEVKNLFVRQRNEDFIKK